MKKSVFLVIWTLFCIFVALGLVELLVRKRVINPSFEMQGVAYSMDNQRLFRTRPLSRGDISPLGTRVNQLGADKIDKNRKTVLVLGDSFTFGSNVDCDQTIPAHLERALGGDYQVVNMGVVAYGPDQSFIQLQQDGLKLNPALVILALFPANDFADIYKNDIFDVDSDGNAVPTPMNSLAQQMPRFQSELLWDLVVSGRTSRPSQFMGIYRSFFYDNYDVELIKQPHSERSKHMSEVMRGVLRAYRDLLAERKIGFLVVAIPPIEPYAKTEFFAEHEIPKDKYFVTEDLVETFCREEGIACINLHTIFSADEDPGRLYDHEDHHLSPDGYRHAALQIQKWMSEQK